MTGPSFLLSQCPALRALRVMVFAVTGIMFLAPPANAQYFGRNKVRYDQFRFQVLQTEHFDIYYYPVEEAAAQDVGRMAERWYLRLSGLLAHELKDRKPIILYADSPDFQQTTVISGFIGEGTGGVTESLKDRVVIPMAGGIGETDHVLGHELVHVFQYDMAASSRSDSLRFRMQNLPLWLVEGMAEYLSVGREDPHTVMWLRDALMRDDFPKVKDLANSSRYFPYRFGQAFWAFAAGQWGDPVVPEFFREVGRRGLPEAVRKVFGTSVDTLSIEWDEASRAELGGKGEETVSPGRDLLSKESGAGEINLAPALSHDGRRIAFLSEKGIFSIDLYLADATTGEILQRLTRSATDPHFDALRFIDSAGSWSPDGRSFAFVVTRRGGNSLAIVDVASGEIRTIRQVEGADALSNPAWSPDGSRICVTGSHGGLLDLYLVDPSSGSAERLTRDAYAELQPCWSPDGRSLVFVTDRGEGTDLDLLQAGPLRLARLDLSSRQVEVLDPFPGAKQICPQFGPDGRDLFFISDLSGRSEVYRLEIATGELFRVTRVSTGVSGITSSSPALSVASESGRVAFSVFGKGNYSIYTIDPDQARGEPVDSVAPVPALLPPKDPKPPLIVSTYLRDARDGLPPGPFAEERYHPSLSLADVGSPTAGVAFDRYGASFGGAVSFYFTDMLSRRELAATVQGNGGLSDIGGQLAYRNRSHRWTWGASLSHIPYLSYADAAFSDTVVVEGQTYDGVVYQELRERQYNEQIGFLLSYPFSTTRRFEAGVAATRIGFSAELETWETVGGIVVSDHTRNVPSRDALYLGELYGALVGDQSYFGFVSPLKGRRWRLEAAPTFGSLQFVSLLADYRQYFFFRPLTLAWRGLQYGRYGPDSESDDLSLLFVGDASLVRGYESGSFERKECDPDGNCATFNRLLGSRMAVTNLELRLPVLGDGRLGLVSFPFLPTEVAGFVDAGAAWLPGDPVHLVWARNSDRRVPVVSTGGTVRVAVLGAVVVEVYYAYPFQRPQKGAHFGFQLSPGW